jgi:hypothetical protein
VVYLLIFAIGVFLIVESVIDHRLNAAAQAARAASASATIVGSWPSRGRRAGRSRRSVASRDLS